MLELGSPKLDTSTRKSGTRCSISSPTSLAASSPTTSECPALPPGGESDSAEEAGQGTQVAYAIPKEGTIVWFDMLAIPADAKHPKNAHAFINYLMEPQVAANNTNFVNYANANAASYDLVDESVKNDPGVYPTPEVKAKLFPSLAYGEQATATMARLWQKFTTGQ